MSYGPKNTGAVKQYQAVGTHSAVTDATPHRLIQMLMEGAIEKVAKAKGLIQSGDKAGKAAQISWAISIIDGLRMSLDLEQGREIAKNLDDLYDYMGRKLLEANMEDDVERLDEVIRLLGEIKSGWDAMPDSIKQQSTGNTEAERPILRAGA